MKHQDHYDSRRAISITCRNDNDLCWFSPILVVTAVKSPCPTPLPTLARAWSLSWHGGTIIRGEDRVRTLGNDIMCHTESSSVFV